MEFQKIMVLDFGCWLYIIAVWKSCYRGHLCNSILPFDAWTDINPYSALNLLAQVIGPFLKGASINYIDKGPLRGRGR